MPTFHRSKYLYTTFDSLGPTVQNDGTAASGTDEEENLLMIGGVPWIMHVIGTQTVVVPAPPAVGGPIDWVMTDTNGQGKMLVPFGNSSTSPLCFTIGSGAFFCQLTVQVTDWSGTLLQVGFEGGAVIPAITKTWDNYTDKYTIGNDAGGGVNVYINTALNNAADIDTDTTIDLTDGDVMRATVNVSAAGVATSTLELAATATPTTFVTQTITQPSFTFDSTDIVIPMIYMLSHTDTATAIKTSKFVCGYQR